MAFKSAHIPGPRLGRLLDNQHELLPHRIRPTPRHLNAMATCLSELLYLPSSLRDKLTADFFDQRWAMHRTRVGKFRFARVPLDAAELGLVEDYGIWMRDQMEKERKEERKSEGEESEREERVWGAEVAFWYALAGILGREPGLIREAWLERGFPVLEKPGVEVLGQGEGPSLTVTSTVHSVGTTSVSPATTDETDSMTLFWKHRLAYSLKRIAELEAQGPDPRFEVLWNPMARYAMHGQEMHESPRKQRPDQEGDEEDDKEEEEGSKKKKKKMARTFTCPYNVAEDLDMSAVPDLEYMSTTVYSADVARPDPDTMMGCTCKGVCGPGCPCLEENANQYPYAADTKELVFIREKRMPAIIECGSRCSCGPECRMRHISLRPDRFDKLEIFNAAEKGLGIRALEPIPRGMFIGEYIGEKVDARTAAVRRYFYERNNFLYAFALGYDVGDEGETAAVDMDELDAVLYCNLTRFFNHSCDGGNLRAATFFVDHHDRQMQRIGFFSSRPIKKGEELTFDYGFQPNSKCFCFSPQCYGSRELVSMDAEGGGKSGEKASAGRIVRKIV